MGMSAYGLKFGGGTPPNVGPVVGSSGLKLGAVRLYIDAGTSPTITTESAAAPVASADALEHAAITNAQSVVTTVSTQLELEFPPPEPQLLHTRTTYQKVSTYPRSSLISIGTKCDWVLVK